MNIISRKQVWATDLRFMNDEDELSYSHGLIDEAVAFVASRQSDEQHHRWLSVFRGQFSSFVANSRWYSISFCQEIDLPTQWRDYGVGGRGFALGWSIDTLPAERPMQIEVVYELDRQRWFIRKLLNFHTEALRAKKDLGRGRGLDAMLYVSGSLANFFNILLQLQG